MNSERPERPRAGVWPLALALGLLALLHAAFAWFARELQLFHGILSYGSKWPLATLYAGVLPYAIAALALLLGRRRPEGAAGILLGGGLLLGCAYSLAGGWGNDGAKAWGAAYYGVSAAVLLIAWDGWRSGSASASTRNALLLSVLLLGAPFVLDAFIDGRALLGELASARERLSQAQLPSWPTPVPPPTAQPSAPTPLPVSTLAPTARPTAVPTQAPRRAPTPVPTPKPLKRAELRRKLAQEQRERDASADTNTKIRFAPAAPAKPKAAPEGAVAFGSTPGGLQGYFRIRSGEGAELLVRDAAGTTRLQAPIGRYVEAWFTRQGFLAHRNGSFASVWRAEDGKVLLMRTEFVGQDLQRWEPYINADGRVELASRSGLQRRPVTVPQLQGAVGAEEAQALNRLRAAMVKEALEDYRRQNGSYPGRLQDLLPRYLGGLPLNAYEPGAAARVVAQPDGKGGWCYDGANLRENDPGAKKR